MCHAVSNMFCSEYSSEMGWEMDSSIDYKQI